MLRLGSKDVFLRQDSVNLLLLDVEPPELVQGLLAPHPEPQGLAADQQINAPEFLQKMLQAIFVPPMPRLLFIFTWRIDSQICAYRSMDT